MRGGPLRALGAETDLDHLALELGGEPGQVLAGGSPGLRAGAEACRHPRVAHPEYQRAGGVRLRDEHSTGNCGGKSAVGGDERYLECLREHGIEGVVRR